jgi:phosphonopyruvate decarboxylase
MSAASQPLASRAPVIEAGEFAAAAREFGFDFYSGVPCSYLTPLINFAIDSAELRYVGAANEGDAVAIAAGAELGGRRGIVMLQNSGLGNAVSPLASLTHVFRIPVLLISTLRGEPGGPADEPQHELMGAVTSRLLDVLQIPWEYFPRTSAEAKRVMERASEHMERQRRPYALLMRKNAVARRELKSRATGRPILAAPAPEPCAPTASRREILLAVQERARAGDVIVATTGYTGRELFACGDRANQLYMVGSMGCASSLGLGLAIAQPERRIIVVDGDGAALMRLGAMATLGHERPPNLLHVLLDNGMHESTGGQSTVSQSIDFCALALACGYPHVVRAGTRKAVAAEVDDRTPRLGFVHVPIVPGSRSELGRPEIRPVEVAARLKQFLARSA